MSPQLLNLLKRNVHVLQIMYTYYIDTREVRTTLIYKLYVLIIIIIYIMYFYKLLSNIVTKD